MHAIGKNHHIQIVCGIDPERCAGESGVADRARGHLRAAGRGRQHRVPRRARASCPAPSSSSQTAAGKGTSSTSARRRRRRAPFRRVPHAPRRRRARARFHRGLRRGVLRRAACSRSAQCGPSNRPRPIPQLDIDAKLAIAPAIELAIERFAGGIFHRETKQHEPGVAVDRLAFSAGSRAALRKSPSRTTRVLAAIRNTCDAPGRPDACSSRSRSVTICRSSPVQASIQRRTRSFEPHPAARHSPAMSAAVPITLVNDARS